MLGFCVYDRSGGSNIFELLLGVSDAFVGNHIFVKTFKHNFVIMEHGRDGSLLSVIEPLLSFVL
jgi:hypothetical protein